jgi:hypothetical protein
METMHQVRIKSSTRCSDQPNASFAPTFFTIVTTLFSLSAELFIIVASFALQALLDEFYPGFAESHQRSSVLPRRLSQQPNDYQRVLAGI